MNIYHYYTRLGNQNLNRYEVMNQCFRYRILSGRKKNHIPTSTYKVGNYVKKVIAME